MKIATKSARVEKKTAAKNKAAKKVLKPVLAKPSARIDTESGKDAKKPKTPPKIVIRDDYCKGCGICIAFCPTQVLGFKAGKSVVVNLEACTKCTFCELRCPDFAISVED